MVCAACRSARHKDGASTRGRTRLPCVLVVNLITPPRCAWAGLPGAGYREAARLRATLPRDGAKAPVLVLAGRHLPGVDTLHGRRLSRRPAVSRLARPSAGRPGREPGRRPAYPTRADPVTAGRRGKTTSAAVPVARRPPGGRRRRRRLLGEEQLGRGPAEMQLASGGGEGSHLGQVQVHAHHLPRQPRVVKTAMKSCWTGGVRLRSAGSRRCRTSERTGALAPSR
jgi:hypothetical protein